ncbi:MAG: rhomboid family intramembrane serine protease [Candidatus Coatesbacteria bacterium]
MIPLRDINPNERPPLMTGVLILANLVAFGYQILIPESGQNAFFQAFGLIPARYTVADWAARTGLGISPLPFLTSMFLHGGWMHLIGNMWSLWLFGDNVEDRLGSWRFLGFYLLSGLIAGVTQCAVSLHSTIPTIGASGAIAGVMGAYMVLFPKARILTFVTLGFFWRLMEIPAWIFIGFWIVFQLFAGGLALAATSGEAGGIAFWAHIGGFAGGILLLSVLLPTGSRKSLLD